MNIKIFGQGCANCETTERNVREALQESSIEANVEKVSDFKKMMEHGVMSIPAVSIDGKIMCTGRIPAKKEVLEWLKKQDA